MEFNSGLYCALLMVCYDSNAEKNDLAEIARVCSSHYVHSFLYSNTHKKPRMLAVQCCKVAIDGPSAMPLCPGSVKGGVNVSLFCESRVRALQKSHCFNYIHVITSINCNVFVYVCVLCFVM